MARSHGLVGAACACLFFVSGCTLDSFSLNVFGTANNNGPVVTGSLDTVSASAQTTLRNMGLFVSGPYRSSDTVKLASTTKDGKPFTLLLKARKTDHGDETTVSIHWEKDEDGAFWLQLTEGLTRPQTAAPSPYAH